MQHTQFNSRENMEIYCSKLKKLASRLPYKPVPGALGDKIQNEISEEAWRLWLARQTMLINEHRLNVLDAHAQDFLREAMMQFLFSDADSSPKICRP